MLLEALLLQTLLRGISGETDVDSRSNNNNNNNNNNSSVDSINLNGNAGDTGKDTPLDSNDSNPSPDRNDILFLAILAAFFLSFLYLFIRYLLAQSRSFKQVKDSRQKEDLRGLDLSDRRFRFGRIRRSSGGRPWLNTLDSSPLNSSNNDSKTKNSESLDYHDADCLIKSVITTEAAMKEHDPFGVLTQNQPHPDQKKDPSGVFELRDHLEFFSAGILAILCIVLLSNLEE